MPIKSIKRVQAGLEYIPQPEFEYLTGDKVRWTYAITGEQFEQNTQVFSNICNNIGLDFETYCELDINQVGLHRYIYHPSFRPLIASISYYNNDLGRVEDFTFDFVRDQKEALAQLGAVMLRLHKAGGTISAHNSGFERAVLQRMGLPVGWLRDSAVTSRCVGGSSKLEFAARQLLNSQKLDIGKALIKKFCTGATAPTRDQAVNDPEWNAFREYCERDAHLSRMINNLWGHLVPQVEWVNE